MHSDEESNEFLRQNDTVVEVIDRRVWLLKVPHFLYDSWSDLSVPNTDLGTVTIESNSSPGDIPKISMKLNDDTNNSNPIPLNYTLNFVKHPQSRLVFAENEEGKAVSLAGTIHSEFHVTPQMDDAYRRIMRARTNTTSNPRRTTQFVDESASSTKFNILATVNEAKLLQQRPSKRRLSPDSRRERLPKPELMDLLFRAFEREPYWSLKGLSDHSNQPVVS